MAGVLCLSFVCYNQGWLFTVMEDTYGKARYTWRKTQAAQ